MIENNKKIAFRGKYFSLVIQPKVDHKIWASDVDDYRIEEILMSSGFPLWTEVEFLLNQLRAEDVTKSRKLREPVDWAFGTETSTINLIPHYQVYIKFDVIIRKSSVFEQVESILSERSHLAVKVVFTEDYKQYCLKATDSFSFKSQYYWDVKRTKNSSDIKYKTLLTLRPRLKMIKENYYTGQKLLLKAVQEEPDDRTAIWFADVLGCTGKTSFFQTIISDPLLNGVFLKVTDGQERLSAKFRKKITSRLEEGRGYPKFCWINFGRTVTESNLKTFADFGEQILDGMLDDNFGNTGGDDFIPLPYMNLFITANTPPNLKLLTGDRLKLVTLVPIRDSNQNIIDTVLLPVYVEIVVRVAKTSKQNCRYRYKVRVQDKKYAEQNFSAFSWYPELLENIDKFNDYMRSCISSSSTTRANTPSSFIAEQTDTLFSRWVTQYGTKLNEDILEVYVDALDHLYRVEGALMVEASSFHGSKPKVLEYYEDNKAFTENSKKQIPDPFKFLED